MITIISLLYGKKTHVMAIYSLVILCYTLAIKLVTMISYIYIYTCHPLVKSSSDKKLYITIQLCSYSHPRVDRICEFLKKVLTKTETC